MSDHSGLPHSGDNQRARQSLQCYQSVWMSRWTNTSCSDASQVQNGLSLSLMSNGGGDANKFTEVSDTRAIRITNEGVTRQFNSVIEIASQVSGSREHNIQSDRISHCLEEPPTQMIPYGSNKRKAPQISPMGRQEKGKQISLCLASKEFFSNHRDTKHECNPDVEKFSILGRDKYWDHNSTSGKFGNSVLRQSNASLSLCDSPTGRNLLPLFVGEPLKKIQNVSFTETSSRITSVKDKELVNFSNEASPFRRMPGFLCDMGTVGSFTANYVDGLPGGPANFSPTTHNTSFVKSADNKSADIIKKSKQKQGFKESSNFMNANKNMFSQLLSLSPPFCHANKGVKIQLLDSSSGSQGKGDVQEITNPDVCQRNETSAVSATVDMETFSKHNSHSGVDPGTSNNACPTNFSVSHDPPSQVTTVFVGKKAERQLGATALPDINEIPVLQASSSSMDNAEPSTTRTLSLDGELLLSHSEQPTYQKTSQFPKSAPALQPTTTLEPSSGWLKRLKVNVPHSFGIGTKSSNLGEALSRRKVNKLFSSVITGDKTCIPKQTSYEFDGVEQIASDQPATLLQKVKSSPVKPPNKDLDTLLSQYWIKRWRQGATQKKKVQAVVLCDPQSTKFDFDDLQIKQFPSIGAMALMGKAMTGFQQCEYRKQGPVVVWDAKGL